MRTAMVVSTMKVRDKLEETASGQVKYSLGLSLSLDLGSEKCQARGRALPSPGAGG